MLFILLPKKLSECDFPMLSEQAYILNDVYNLLLNASFDSEGQDIEIDHPALVSLMHRFLALILLEEHDPMNKVSGLLEHAMAFLPVTPEGKICSASILTGDTAQ